MLAFPAVPMLVWMLARLAEPAQSAVTAAFCGLAFSVVTTFTHSVPYLFVFALGWTAFVGPLRTVRAFGKVLIFFCGLAAGDSPQLLAAMANAPFSQRGDWPVEAIDLSTDGLFYRQLQFDYFNQDPLMKAITLTLPGVGVLAGVGLAWHLRQARPELRGLADSLLRVSFLYLILSQKWLMVAAQDGVGVFLPWVRGIYMGRFYTLPAAFLIACALTLTAQLCARSFLVSGWLKRLGMVSAAVFIGFMIIRPKIFLFYPIGVEGWGERNYQVAALEDLKHKHGEPFRVASVLPLQPSYAYAQGLETADVLEHVDVLEEREVLARHTAHVLGHGERQAGQPGRSQREARRECRAKGDNRRVAFLGLAAVGRVRAEQHDRVSHLLEEHEM